MAAKIDLLLQDPLPNGNNKLQIRRKYNGETVYRLRSGHFRIRYTLKKSCIGLLDVKRRSEHNYDEQIDDDEDFDDVEFDDDLSADAEEHATAPQPDWERLLAPKAPEKKLLPEPITMELLTNLRVPREYYARLLRITTEDDLLDCPGVPDEILLKIDEYMFGQPLTQIVQQPDYVLNAPDDLIRFKEGELLTFLLKLSPEQEKLATWSTTASGPTLLKGGPGTGKSTLALYRIHSLIEQLRQQTPVKPRILFTTYTNALVRSSEQQLQQLLGKQADCVVVSTADKIATDILSAAGVPSRTPSKEYTRTIPPASGPSKWISTTGNVSIRRNSWS
ncbi:MAG TPA: UvrD-helicase domain-containing protein [Ktedonobacteraceae bacterium]|nr:UvrD-helicase domain-containing protein [Ktedonobacteraceae bacterium]